MPNPGPNQQPRIVTIPSSDRAFAAAVRAVARAATSVTEESVRQGLLAVYPDSVVRRRDISWEQGETLYAYRDRTFLRDGGDRGDGWTDEPGVAWAAFDPATGRILAENAALVELFVGQPTMVGRYAREFVPSGADAISDEQLAAIRAAGRAHSVGLGQRGDGRPIRVEFVAEVVDDRILAWYREVVPDRP